MVSLNDLATPLNGVVASLLRSPLHGLASKGLMVMAWEGRASGRSFAVPVGYQPLEDGVIVLISKRDTKTWWKNFRTPWPAVLTVRGEEKNAMGKVVPPGSEEFFAHCEKTLRRLPWMASQFGGFQYDRNQGLDDAAREALVQNVGAVRFGFVG